MDSVQRALPFITETLSKVIGRETRVRVMQEASDRREESSAVSVSTGLKEIDEPHTQVVKTPDAVLADPHVKQVLDVFKGRVREQTNTDENG